MEIQRKTAAESLPLDEVQRRVDEWIRTVGVRYFNELTNTAVLMEEVGELARIMARAYGEQSFKPGEGNPEQVRAMLAEELADILWVVVCLANQTGTDLTEAFRQSMEKKTRRDRLRHRSNPKLVSGPQENAFPEPGSGRTATGKRLVIFDLDGTLLHTVGDIAAATNHALKSCGYPERTTEEIQSFIGNGINKLFERSLPEGHKTEAEVLRVRAAFIPYYNAHGTEHTRPFPGIPALLDRLNREGIAVAVASNKYQQATAALIPHFFPDTVFCAVLGQREGIAPKPDPGIVFEICRQAGISPAETLYVGDSGVDMETARNAGTDAAGVTWGCRTREELAAYAPAWLAGDAAELEQIVFGDNSGKISGETDTPVR